MRSPPACSADRRRAGARDSRSARGQSGSLGAVDVVIVDYDPAWPQRFADEAARVAPIVGADVHHIGSTAVPGLAAKPVIDLMALVPDIEAPIERLISETGYEYPREL